MSFYYDGGAAVTDASSVSIQGVGEAGAPPFEGTWVDSGDSDNDPAGYTIINNVVYLVGVVKSGVIGTTVFTLPSGFRPTKRKVLTCVSNGALGVITILATGEVQVTVGNILGVSLDGIAFVVV
jgi:hypothetical protein